MSKIFISYRRTDSDIVGRLTDQIIAVFGKESVFLDVDNIPIGKDFRTAIDEAINQCQCIVVVIGEGWVRASEEIEGKLYNANDFVRLEVKSALNAKLPIIPVLVGEVDMPDSDTLPEDIRDIAFINATTVRSGRDFRQDMDFLINVLNSFLSTETTEQASLSHKQQSVAVKHASNFVNISSDQLINHPKSIINERIGRYILKEYLASGGSGAVYRAIDTNISKTVCIKIAFPLRKETENLKSLISKSIKGLVQMQHHNVVEIFDFDSFFLSDKKQTFFISMQLEQGVDLNQWNFLLGVTRSDFRKKLRCAIQICETLDDAHNFHYIGVDGLESIGILHGDIKPSNIIINNDSPKLLDFMLVNIQSLQNPEIGSSIIRKECPTMAFGTPSYMAPEQENSGVITRKTDIYSLGITLLDLFKINIKNYSANKDSEITDKTIGNLINLINKCTHKVPGKRPENMPEIKDALQIILDSSEVEPKKNFSDDTSLSNIVTLNTDKSKPTMNELFCYHCGANQRNSDPIFRCSSCEKLNNNKVTSTLHSCGKFSPLIFNYCRKCGQPIE